MLANRRKKTANSKIILLKYQKNLLKIVNKKRLKCLLKSALNTSKCCILSRFVKLEILKYKIHGRRRKINPY